MTGPLRRDGAAARTRQAVPAPAAGVDSSQLTAETTGQNVVGPTRAGVDPLARRHRGFRVHRFR